MRRLIGNFMAAIPLIISGTLSTPDHQRIAYDYYNAGHKKIVVIAHGFFNSKDAVLIRKLKDYLIDSYDIFIFDLRGHGKSTGLFTWTSKEHIDLETVMDYVKQKYDKIGIIGFSYGAAISIQYISEHDSIASLVAISAPYDSMKIDYHFWNLDIENDILFNLGEGGRNKGIRPGPFWLKKKRPVDLVGTLKCPVFYIHGEKDWVTSYRQSEKLYEKTNSKKKIEIIKGGSHAEYLLRKNPEAFVGMIKDWFKETL
ncbi:MAG: alpha/beta hydrolase [Candidatus Omnitrophica bacterium]|nr:alpha/beta hydrolase [Candidatus Omnitrophota bacterium]